MFYCFIQNNSGGHFDYDKVQGISHYVVIEGDSVEDIENKAENIGIYFDGCDKGFDCLCCGDRWYPPCSEEFTEEALITT